MGKLTLQDFAGGISERYELTKKEASTFLSAMFDVIQEGLEQDRIVKVKGLGTFKIIDVEPRESINVNTGERVLIEGHSKITFTPDSLMKELVNKPFSQFETVVLNDGVDFNDMEATVPTTEDTTQENVPSEETEVQPKVEEPLSEAEEPQPEVEEAVAIEALAEMPPTIEETPQVEEQSIPQVGEATLQEEETVAQEEEAVPEEDVTEEEPQEEVEEDYEAASEEEPEEEQRSNAMRWIVPVLTCAAGLAVGYFLGTTFGHGDGVKQEPVKPEAPKAVASPTTKQDTAKAVAIAPEKKDTVKAAPTPVEKETAQESASEDLRSKYEAMDARVRTGAYIITGTDHVIKAKEGDTSVKIANRTLGPGMECYIEVFNGLKGSTILSAGETVKIPKLELKKRKKKSTDE